MSYDKKNPYSSAIVNIYNLNDERSDKETYHIEFDLANSGVEYEAGDALGVITANDTQEVEVLLSACGLSAQETVTIDEESYSLYEALLNKRAILTPNKPSLRKLFTGRDGDPKRFLKGFSFADIISSQGITLSPQELVDTLPNLTPRLYSIASALDECKDQVHLTVGKAWWRGEDDKIHWGQASGFLSKVKKGDKVPIYIHTNKSFRLPQQSSTPVIMIGAGTGIAPFRSFIQYRHHNGKGKNWIFFGERQRAYDYLYEKEWDFYTKEGTLTNISLAFSRDQADKVYVQDALIKHGKEVVEWLDEGAYIYVCGAIAMAKRGQ